MALQPQGRKVFFEDRFVLPLRAYVIGVCVVCSEREVFRLMSTGVHKDFISSPQFREFLATIVRQSGNELRSSTFHASSSSLNAPPVLASASSAASPPNGGSSAGASANADPFALVAGKGNRDKISKLLGGGRSSFNASQTGLGSNALVATEQACFACCCSDLDCSYLLLRRASRHSIRARARVAMPRSKPATRLAART